MPVALILVEGLSPSYILSGALPSVAHIAAGGMTSPMENMYAYRGIEATLLTGRPPAEHGVWGEFRPTAQPKETGRTEQLFQDIVNLGDRLPFDRLRFDVRNVAARLQRDGHVPTGSLIPAALMPYFERSVATGIWAPGCLPVPTLFDEVRAAGGSFEAVAYPAVGRDDEVVPWVKHRLHDGSLPDFWYVRFSALDALGHRYGPHPNKFPGALKALNAQIAELTAALRKAYGAGLDIVLLSDHGMSQVTRIIDARPILARTGLIAGRDYLYFLDASTIRLWSDSPRSLEILASSFSRLAGAHVVDRAERARLRIPDGECTGDVLVTLDEGVGVFPDFFRASITPLGMHGYAQVLSVTGLPFLAAAGRMAVLLGYDAARGSLGHAAVWSAVRRRLGLGAETSPDQCDEAATVPTGVRPEEQASRTC